MSTAVDTKEGKLILDSHKLSYHMDRVQAWESGERIAPISVDMALTRACGAMCTFCYAMVQESQERSSVRTPVALKLVDDFERLGIILEPFGKKSICVRSLPEILGQVNCSLFLNDLADELLEHNNISVAEEKLEKVISKIACHGSVRSGRKLNPTEMSVLLRTMEETPFSNQCNHGRPTFIELKLKDIEKLFNRN